MHFGFDPGQDYDWSRFPDTRPLDPNNNEQPQVPPNNNINNNPETIEISRDERMFLIQKYLDIVKLELFDPGPATVKRVTNLAINSSGMRVNVVNVNVPLPPTITYQFSNQRQGSNKTSKSIKQKFLNIFKRVSIKTK